MRRVSVTTLLLLAVLASASAPAAGADLRVVDPSGAPLEGARVVAESTAHADDLYGRQSSLLADGTTGPDGRLDAPLPHLPLLLLVDHPGYRLHRAHLDGPPADPVVLHPGLPVEGRLESRTDGVAVREAEICARWRSEGRTWQRCTRELDQHGAFRLPGLDGGEVRVQVHAPGFLPLEDAFTVLSDGTIRSTDGPQPGDASANASSRRAPSSSGSTGVPAETAEWVLRLERGHLLRGRVTGRRTPVAGATVRSDAGGRDHTDRSGTFELAVPNLPARLTVTAPGFREASVRVARLPEDPDGLHLHLEPGESISGILVSEDSSPVEEARIWLARLQGDAARTESRERVATEDGEFQLDLGQPGRYRVRVGAEGYSSQNLGEITVAEGEHRDLGVVALSRGAGVRGVVLDDASGEPVPGASVELVPQGTALYQALRQGGLHRTATDPQGRFELFGLDAGRFELRARHDDYATTTDRFSLDRDEAVDLGEVMLEPGVRLRATLVDREGQPRPGLLARVLDPEGGSLTPLAQARSDREGRLEELQLASGRYRIEVYGDRLLLTQEIELPRGEETAERELVVGGVELSGVVTRDGEPVAGGFLSLTSSLDPGQHRGKVLMRGGGSGAEGFGFSHSQLTADVAGDGSFRIQDAPAGALQVTFHGDDGSSVQRRVVVPDVPRHELVLEIGGYALRGRVTEAESGAPLPAATVRVLDFSGTVVAQASSGPDGAFRVQDLESGEYTVEVEAEGFQAAVEPGVRVGPSTPPLQVALERGGGAELVIRLSRRDGSPMAGVPVTLLTEGGRMVRALLTDGSGERRYGDLTPGAYFVVWSDAHSGTGISEPILLEDGETRVWDRVTPPGGSVEVTCPPDACAGLPVDHLAVYSPTGVDIGPYLSGISPALRFSRQGRLALGRLSHGTYLLRVWAGGTSREEVLTVGAEREVVGLVQ